MAVGFRGFWNRAGQGAAAFAVMASTGGEALAGGGFPRAYEMLFEPGVPNHVVVRSEAWGLYDSRDGGLTWRHYCAEAFEGDSIANEAHPVVVTEGGRIVVGSPRNGVRITDDGCDWWTIAVDDSGWVAGLALAKTEGTELLALTTGGGANGVVSRIFRSLDRGDSWQLLGEPLPLDFSADTLASAPAHPDRLYAFGAFIGADTVTVLRSDDAGATFRSIVTPMPYPASAEVVATMHPTRPDVLFARVDGWDGGGPSARRDELWLSVDRADTWNLVHAAAGDLPGLAVSPDGLTVSIGGPDDGLLEADVDALAAGSGFRKVREGKVWGLAWSEGNLYVGDDEFTPRESPRATLSVLSGSAMSPVMSFCDPELAVCAPDSVVGRACPIQWADYMGHFGSQPRCTGGASMDAGVDAGRGLDARGGARPACHCSLESSRRGRFTGWAGLLVVVLAASARRRFRGTRARLQEL